MYTHFCLKQLTSAATYLSRTQIIWSN